MTGKRAKPEFLALWDQQQADKYYIPSGKMLPIKPSFDALKNPLPAEVRCPTEDEFINAALLFLTKTPREYEHPAHSLQQLLGWPGLPGSLWVDQLEAILPFIRRLLLKRGIEWKNYTTEPAQKRNKSLIKKYRKLSMIP